MLTDCGILDLNERAVMSRKYIMYPHAGSGNHGCEAIVRTTVRLLGEENDFTLFSDGITEDQTYIQNRKFDLKLPHKTVKRFSLDYLSAFWKYHVGHEQAAYDLVSFSPILNECAKDTVLLSIGGDNYCYGDNNYIYMVNRAAKAKGCKTVLWGCSVEPKDISAAMEEDLKSYDFIVARESITFHSLKKINHRVALFPDPAFSLPIQNGIWPSQLEGKSYIGINMSPMIQSKESKPGIVLENYKFLIQKILENTDYQIAFIPHVVKPGNDDRVAMQKLYDEVGCSDRVVLVPDQNCMQLKEIISQCVCFVGARTHATIAAYSTNVPTLVVGYSVKARGIARDLFGEEKNYVLPVQELRDEADLYHSFLWIMEHRTEISQRLKAVMPQFVKKLQELRAVMDEEVWQL